MEQSIEERELELYIDNDVTLYNQKKLPIEKNLIKKVASGTFDINQAPKIYMFLINDGIKKYTKDFGGISLSKSEKENLAKDYVNKFLDDADGGQFDEFIPKKYKMAEGGGVTFDEKVSSISKSLLKRKKVSPSVQKDYGKTYNKKEAIESAKRIAGKIRAKEMIKKKD
jgi:hypothetical protein